MEYCWKNVQNDLVIATLLISSTVTVAIFRLNSRHFQIIFFSLRTNSKIWQLFLRIVVLLAFVITHVSVTQYWVSYIVKIGNELLPFSGWYRFPERIKGYCPTMQNVHNFKQRWSSSQYCMQKIHGETPRYFKWYVIAVAFKQNVHNITISTLSKANPYLRK